MSISERGGGRFQHQIVASRLEGSDNEGEGGGEERSRGGESVGGTLYEHDERSARRKTS